ncbi:penicillin acylase family protein, partial [bacterium]|nr:penicillin acylase family protein [bacterium]
MRKGLKIGLIVISVIIAGFIGLGILGYRMITSSLPMTEGEIVLQAIHGDVRVYRDGFHIPHIIAQNEHDLFFAQGYVTAQDRLWQMDLWKRTAEGRLSAIFGRTTLSMDSLMLTIGIHRTARRIVPHLSQESQDVFGAYVKGVNAYIQDNNHRLPIEFRLLDYTPEPWLIEDCVAILRFFGWQANPGWKTDITLTLLAEK